MDNKHVSALRCLSQAIAWLAESNLSQAIERMAWAADYLGYDLVKRQTPAEAHEAALQRGYEWDRDYGQQDITMRG